MSKNHPTNVLPISRRPTLAQIDLRIDGPAANDSGSLRRATRPSVELDTTVASVLGDVVARCRPSRVNVELSLGAPGRWVAGDPVEVEFAISGLLATFLSHIEDGEGSVLRVATDAAMDTVRVIVVGDDVPPLRCLRAAAPGSAQGQRDPTLVHCRRLVETLGGSFELASHGGRVGFSITLPILHRSRTGRMRAANPYCPTLLDAPVLMMAS